MKLLIITFLILSIFVLTGCDPYYNISVTNSTKNTIFVQFKPNKRFRTAEMKLGRTVNGFETYKVSPKGEIRCGYAIADLDNDIPFKEIKIINKRDTVRAKDIKDIIALFDTDKDGKLKIPYNITVRSKKRNKEAL